MKHINSCNVYLFNKIILLQKKNLNTLNSEKENFIIFLVETRTSDVDAMSLARCCYAKHNLH